ATFVVLASMLALLPSVAAALSLVSAHRAVQGIGLELARRVRPDDLLVHEGPLENSGALEWYTGHRPVIVDGRRSVLAFGALRPEARDVFWDAARLEGAWGGGSAAEDALQLLLGRHWAQPPGLDGPEDAPLAEAPEGAERRRVHHAPRRTEVTGRVIRERGERLVGATDLLGGPPRPAEPQGPMRPPVARDFVAFAGDAVYGVGRPSRALAHQEERRAHSALREEVEDAWCPVGIGTVVERERHAPARVAAAPDAAEREQVGAPRICRPPGSRGETKPRQDHGRPTGRSRSSSTAATMRCVASGRRTRRIRARSRSRRSGSPRARSSRWTSSR